MAHRTWQHVANRLLDAVGKSCILPSKRLAFNAYVAASTGSQEREVGALDRLATGRGTAIDVGANRGDYTWAMSRLFREVWAFEPNVAVSSPIRDAKLANVHLVDEALSSAPGEATLKIPVKNGQRLAGWATLEASPLNPEFFIEVPIRTATLDSHGLVNVSFIKIDVEGHEMATLEGARETIGRDLPVCLIEADASRVPVLNAYFSGLSNRYVMHRQWHDVAMSPQNVLFVPSGG